MPRTTACLALVVVLSGLAIRAWELDYGLPKRSHPDEGRLVDPALRIADPAEADFVRELGTDASGYTERARFELDYFTRDLYAGLDPTFANYPPPGVVIYERRRSSAPSPHRAAP